MRPSLSRTHNGVALIGEALGENEAEEGSPFVGKAGFKLSRMIEFAGLNRADFDIYNVAWCRPPGNKLEGTPFEYSSINHCREAHWGKYLSRSKVVVPLGNVPTHAFLGQKGILSIRGYIYPGPQSLYVVPTVHPSFINRGNSKWTAAFINDLQKAVEVAQNGIPPQFLDYTIDPSPLVAYEWAKEYQLALRRDPTIRLAFDIETPGKPEDEDEAELGDDAPDKTWFIWRIGFSYGPLRALSIPWEPPFLPAIKLLLGSAGDKIVWNAGFDVPRVRRAGVAINGTIHDGMVAWHILHSDLPKKLGFVATFTCPWQPAWKHLSGSQPGFYNATDADVEWRAVEVIFNELRRTGLWGVYQRDVLDLEPVLVHMQLRGMPVDSEVRLDRSKRLASRLQELQSSLAGLFPLETRKIEHVYVNTPKDTTGLLVRPGVRSMDACPKCGTQRPRKEHFKTYVRRVNPCSGLTPITVSVEVEEYYRLAEFKPSRDQLIRYHQFLKRPMPMVWDKKTKSKKISFGEAQIKKLILKYPDDLVYNSILEYRAIDKLAGTYIGRPVDVL